MLKVLHVGPSLSLKGGIVKVIKNLVMEKDYFLGHGYSQSIYETSPARGMFGYISFLLQSPRFIKAAYNKDLIHFHVASNGSFYRKIILFLISLMLCKKTIIHLHGGGFFDFFDNSNKYIKKLIFIFFHKCTSIVVVSDYSAKQLKKRMNVGSKIFLVPNSSPDFENISLTECRPKNSSTILFCGTLVAYKGLDDLLQALKLLKERGVTSTLIVAGPGDIEPWFKRAQDLGVEDIVSFCGWIDGDKKINLYKDSSIFCLPSHYESFGISALEAMHCSKAVVCTNVGGLPDLVEHQHNGLICAPGDIPALAENLTNLLTNKELSDQLGIHGKIKAQKQFSTEYGLEQLALTYKKSKQETHVG